MSRSVAKCLFSIALSNGNQPFCSTSFDKYKQMHALASCTGTRAYMNGKKLLSVDNTNSGRIRNLKAFQSKTFSRNFPISSLIAVSL